MHIWGITGGIGSGKSFLLEVLANKGYEVLDADKVARQIVDASDSRSAMLLDEIKKTVGPQAIDANGLLNRAYLRSWMSHSSENRQKLEKITHPRIREKILEWIDVSQKKLESKLGFIEASRMIESGLVQKLDGVIWVKASHDNKVARALERDTGSSENEIKALIQLQLDDDQFEKAATYVIENNGTKEEFLEKINLLLPKLLLFLLFSLVPFSANAVEPQEWFPSAKARSWGMAMTAFVDDHNSLHMNPAGLASIKERKMRMPDLLMGSVSNSFSDLIKKFQDLQSDGSSSIAEQLQSLNGTTAGLELSVLGAYWLRNRFGVSVTPFGLSSNVRVRTPSLLFAKVDLYSVAQGGVTVGYGHPVIPEHLRVGIALRPFSYRIGLDMQLENQNIPTVSENMSKYSGAGWGIDFDLGSQANLSPILLDGGAYLDLMAGLVLQNTLASKYSFPIFSDFQGTPPPNQRRLNFGLAARLRSSGILQPTFSVEFRDMLSSYEEFLEFLHFGFELKITPRDFYSTAVRVHYAKGNVGGGMGYRWKFLDFEAGTYAVNLGRGAGIGRDRRYYAQAAFEY